MNQVSGPGFEIVKFSILSRILQCLLLMTMIILSALLALFPFFIPWHGSTKGGYFLSALGFLLVLGFTYSLISAFKAKVIFYKDRVVQIGIFKTRTVAYNNILGYRITYWRVNFGRGENILSLIPSRADGSEDSHWINIDLKRSKMSQRLQDWIKYKFADLD